MLIKCKAKEHRICDYLVCLCVFGAHANHKSSFFNTQETSIVSWRKRLCRWMPSSFNTLSLLWINATEFNLKDLPASCQCVRSVTNEQQTFFCCYRFIIIWCAVMRTMRTPSLFCWVASNKQHISFWWHYCYYFWCCCFCCHTRHNYTQCRVFCARISLLLLVRKP